MVEFQNIKTDFSKNIILLDVLSTNQNYVERNISLLVCAAIIS